MKDNVGHGETIHPNREGGLRFSACKKFAQYILGKSFVIETDNKPLVPLLRTKNLDSMPPRILRFRLRLADALSWAPTVKSDDSEKVLEEETGVLKEPHASKQGKTGGVQNCTVGRPYLLEGGELLSEWLAWQALYWTRPQTILAGTSQIHNLLL